MQGIAASVGWETRRNSALGFWSARRSAGMSVVAHRATKNVYKLSLAVRGAVSELFLSC